MPNYWAGSPPNCRKYECVVPAGGVGCVIKSNVAAILLSGLVREFAQFADDRL